MSQIFEKRGNKKYDFKSEKKLLDYRAFEEIHRKFPKPYKGGGFFVFNLKRSKILLVKGKLSCKWGPPKGHPMTTDNCAFKTATRELKEETGINLDYCEPRIFPNTTIKGIKMYYILIPENIRLCPLDKEEIEEIRWFELKGLNRVIKESPESFNSIIKELVFNRLKDAFRKMHRYYENYDGKLNRRIRGIINYWIKNGGTNIASQYKCYRNIQQQYGNELDNDELVMEIKSYYYRTTVCQIGYNRFTPQLMR